MNTKLTWMRTSLVLARALIGIVRDGGCSYGYGYEDEIEIARIVLRSADVIKSFEEMEEQNNE